MNTLAIVTNAPDKATHVAITDNAIVYIKSAMVYDHLFDYAWRNGEWVRHQVEDCRKAGYEISSLSDIRRIVQLEKEIQESNEIMGECWAMVGNDIDYEHGGYSTLHEHVNALKELATAAARDLNKLEDENAILITRLAALSIKFGEELPRTSEVLKEFATDQKIDELERFVQAFSKAALAAPVPEINRRANELIRAAIVGALKTATQDRINLLRQQQNEDI